MGGGGGELRYKISQNAHIKLVLYARKPKTATVNRVLVGRVSPQKNDVVEITDSVPRLSPVIQYNNSIAAATDEKEQPQKELVEEEEEHTTNNIIAGAKDSAPESS